MALNLFDPRKQYVVVNTCVGLVVDLDAIDECSSSNCIFNAREDAEEAIDDLVSEMQEIETTISDEMISTNPGNSVAPRTSRTSPRPRHGCSAGNTSTAGERNLAIALSRLPEVRKVAAFGAIAQPLRMQVPRFGQYRRYRIEVPHECADLDLAVWLDDFSRLKELILNRDSEGLTALLKKP